MLCAVLNFWITDCEVYYILCELLLVPAGIAHKGQNEGEE